MERKITIIEDDRFYSMLLEATIKKTGLAKVESYGTGEAFLAQSLVDADLIFLDHQLGEIDGIDVLRYIKSVNVDVPVIFLSAQERLSVAIEALKIGAYDYIEKSEDSMYKVSELVSKLCSDRPRKRTSSFRRFLKRF